MPGPEDAGAGPQDGNAPFGAALPSDGPLGAHTPGALGGVAAIRRALGLGPEEQAVVHRVGKLLTPYVGGWIDTFYTRLLTDPAAMRILDDDARVIRLKRSLTSWFLELFSLPWDEDYERARANVGDTHARMNMPTYLMIVAMSRMRQEVCRTVEDLWDGDPEEARDIASIVGRALDMELTLMLNAFRRSERSAARQKDRMVYAQRAARRFAQTLYDRVDAALCYAELADTDASERREYLAKLKDVLRGLARHDQRLQAQAQVNGMAPGRVRLAVVCRDALADVSLDANTRLSLDVEPEDLEAQIVDQAVQLAVEELAQNAVRHAPGGRIRIAVRRDEADCVVVEVTDEGPGWDASVREFKDIYAIGSGLGLSFCELVTELHQGSIELFRAPSGGAGVRLVLREVVALAP